MKTRAVVPATGLGRLMVVVVVALWLSSRAEGEEKRTVRFPLSKTEVYGYSADGKRIYGSLNANGFPVGFFSLDWNTDEGRFMPYDHGSVFLSPNRSCFLIYSRGFNVYSSATGQRVCAARKVCPESLGACTIDNTGTRLYIDPQAEISCLSLPDDRKVWSVPYNRKAEGQLRRLAISEDGKVLLAGFLRELRLYNAATAVVLASRQIDHSTGFDYGHVRFDPLGKTFVVTERGCQRQTASIRLFDAASLKELNRYEYAGADGWGDGSSSSDLSVIAVDNITVESNGSKKTTVHVWYPKEGNVRMWKFDGAVGSFVSPDGRHLLLNAEKGLGELELPNGKKPRWFNDSVEFPVVPLAGMDDPGQEEQAEKATQRPAVVKGVVEGSNATPK